jgi:hypothetical protein
VTILGRLLRKQTLYPKMLNVARKTLFTILPI